MGRGGQNRKDLTGQRFGRLTVLKYSHSNNGRLWQCQCDCGVIKDIVGYELLSGKTKSCGCLKRERIIKRSTTHGKRKTPEYDIWVAMRFRCNNPNDKSYPSYGGRGIKVCEDWQKFENFIRDMGYRPGKEYSLDRIDVNGNYCKENCRWATTEQQANNKRDTRKLTLDGETYNLTEWSKITGFASSTIYARLLRGWSDEKAITTPLNIEVRKKNYKKKQ